MSKVIYDHNFFIYIKIKVISVKPSRVLLNSTVVSKNHYVRK